ncbi:MAG TPA: NUDIX hydrolase [Verrucomicrobia bacterium]|nr:NUDIX hydrolase [Verrucomicrobiota bacterium]
MKTIKDIDWPLWVPQQRATLLFIIQEGRILLIHKKRGLGAGLVNGPGGRIEPGETPMEGAIREVSEELCITPIGVEYSGTLCFQFTDGLSIHATVFRATGYTGGEPQETDEAIPLWTPLDRIPYERMWSDDRLWLPLMIARETFSGVFLFDRDQMLDYKLESTPPCATSS